MEHGIWDIDYVLRITITTIESRRSSNHDHQLCY